MDTEKLKRMQQSVRIGTDVSVYQPSSSIANMLQGMSALPCEAARLCVYKKYSWHTNINDSGKGTPRRKTKKVHKSSVGDDKKLQSALKKLNTQPIQAIEEVNMFKEDGNVIHFAAPKGTFFPNHRVYTRL